MAPKTLYGMGPGVKESPRQGRGEEGQMAAEVLYKAIVQESGNVLADKIAIADSLGARAKGLLGKMRMEDGQGLLIKPCSSIHMFFMKFPIDVLFLTKDGSVIKIVKRLRPWKLSGCWFGCHMVLELKEGALGKDEDFYKKHIKFVKI